VYETIYYLCTMYLLRCKKPLPQSWHVNLFFRRRSFDFDRTLPRFTITTSPKSVPSSVSRWPITSVNVWYAQMEKNFFFKFNFWHFLFLLSLYRVNHNDCVNVLPWEMWKSILLLLIFIVFICQKFSRKSLIENNNTIVLRRVWNIIYIL